MFVFDNSLVTDSFTLNVVHSQFSSAQIVISSVGKNDEVDIGEMLLSWPTSRVVIPSLITNCI